MLIAKQRLLITQKETNSSCSSSSQTSPFTIMQDAAHKAHESTTISPTTKTPQKTTTQSQQELYSGVEPEQQIHHSSFAPASKDELSPVGTVSNTISISRPAVVQIASRRTLYSSGATTDHESHDNINKRVESPSSLSPRCTSTNHFGFAGTSMMAGQFPHHLTTTPPRRPPPTTHVFFPMDCVSPPLGAFSAHAQNHHHVQQPLHWNIATNNNMTSSPRSVPSSGISNSSTTARSVMLQPIHNHGPRTPPEVLKTLLRKKACLYEAGTSYAIAIVTWLVGRSLTMTFGYFSRQQLQYGVHQAVSDIIDSGSITRTKVNRCMQIILNSCFHYVIPHPKTDDVSSKRFRDKFSSSLVTNDDCYYLLQSLDPPWDDLDVFGAMEKLLIEVVNEESDNVYNFEEEEEEHDNQREPRDTSTRNQQWWEGESSPKLTSFSRRDTATFHSNEHATDIDGEDGSCSIKRAVLLCFNESVTSFENVWRCHSEFIRDVARAGNLKLTAQEWKEFFTRDMTSSSSASCRVPGRGTIGSSSAFADTSSEDGSYSQGGTSLSSPRLPPLHPSPASQHNRRVVPQEPLIPDFFLDGRQHHHQSYAAAAAATPQHAVGDENNNPEMDQRFAVMDENELSKFRTQWCTKRYDHDPRVCTFAHTKINQGWLRRNPSTHSYKDEFCPNILMIVQPRHFLDGCSFNKCPRGVHCEFCHSQEEMEYHPYRYKRQRQICPVFTKVSKEGGDLFDSCDRDHTCPYVHPIIKSPCFTGGAMTLGRGSNANESNVRSSGGMRYGSSASQGSSRIQHHPRSPRTQGKSLHHSDVSSSSFASEIMTPVRSPMMYVSPAPESSYEKSLALPGLRSLFRQHSAVLYSYMKGAASIRTNADGNICAYQYIGDQSERNNNINQHRNNLQQQDAQLKTPGI